MPRIDPRIRLLLESHTEMPIETVERLGAIGSESAERAPAIFWTSADPPVEVLVRFRNGSRDTEILEAANMEIREIIDGPYVVVSGVIPLSGIDLLREYDAIRSVEAVRQLTPELDLCLPEIAANVVHDRSIRGVGSLIGIIDSGIDFFHPDFQNPDGTSRIRYLWDQTASFQPEGTVLYGREYNQTDINGVLDGSLTGTDIRLDREGHGTHVAGIAAGNGRADASCVGVAPAADLIIVSLGSSGGETLGRSGQALEAFQYIINRAQAEGLPVAINFSQGMNGGGHIGETALETGLDNLARLPGVVIVKSAGNEQPYQTHAGGILSSGQTIELYLTVGVNNRLDDIIEIWFDDQDDIRIALVAPGGEATPFVAKGENITFLLTTKNRINVSLDADSEQTGDTVATIIMSQGQAAMIQPGTWKLLLKAGEIRKGRYDAWIERTVRRSDMPGEQTRFRDDSYDPTRTISIPGTARHIITVGSYITRPSAPTPEAPLGALSLFSSRGPTRYGRIKPDIAAPGQVIQSAGTGTGRLVKMSGTSMAAPAVTGAAALLLSQRRDLTCDQVKQLLTTTARRTGAAVEAPNNAWGYGKINVDAALAKVTVAFPLIRNVVVADQKITWETDMETTGAVRYLENRRQLLLGKDPTSIADLTFSVSHNISFAHLTPGIYYVEIIAFSAENYWTEDDNAGRCYEIRVTGNAEGDQAI